jgi:RNA polymerase sigma-70 factor, ECF subfamily
VVVPTDGSAPITRMPGDEAATQQAYDFELIVEEYQQRAFRLVCAILGPGRADYEADDVLQDVFLKVYENLSQFRGESALGTWIYSVARNKALDRRRLARNRWEHVEMTPERASAESDVQRQLEMAEAIERLPETYRTILHLYYWQQASLAEISEVTGIKEGTIKSYLARARQNLEAILEYSKQ